MPIVGSHSNRTGYDRVTLACARGISSKKKMIENSVSFRKPPALLLVLGEHNFQIPIRWCGVDAGPVAGTYRQIVQSKCIRGSAFIIMRPTYANDDEGDDGKQRLLSQLFVGKTDAAGCMPAAVMILVNFAIE